MSNLTTSMVWQPRVRSVLDRLHTLADAHDDDLAERIHGDPVWRSGTSEQRATMAQDVLLAVSRDAGRLLYAITRSVAAKRIVEFGTSFGVSTIYFAAALHDNGGGVVIGSELASSKVTKAQRNLAEAGLSEFAEIRAGDATQTLQDTGGVIDLLFLDGWKDLYLDVLLLASTSLRPGSVVLADDVSLFPDRLAQYLRYVRDPTNGFVSVLIPVGDGIEYSVRL